MTRLRIYSGGTGNIQYDSSGSPDERRNERASREFNAGVLLYYLPTRGQLHGYVKLHRRAEEQFLAVYEDESDDLVDGFKTAVERAANERDWRIASASQINQEVFEALGTDRTTEPNVGTDQLRGELDRNNSLEFTAGDGRSAVELFEYLRREFPERTIAITTGGGTWVTEEADMVIEVDSSYTHSQPTVAGDTATRLHERRIEVDKDALREGLDRVGEVVDASSRASLGRRVATMLNSVGLEEQFGIVVRGEGSPSKGQELFGRYALVSFALVTLVGILFVIQFATSGLGAPFDRPLSLALPGVSVDSTLPSWLVLLSSVLVIAMAVLSTRFVRETLGFRLPSLVSSLVEVLFPGGSRRGSTAERQQAQAVVDTLAQLQSRTTSDERFVREVKDVLTDYGVVVTTRTAATQDRRRQRILGFAVGAALGGGLPLLAYVALARIVDVVSAYWRTFVLIAVALAIAALFTRVSVLLARFVVGWGRTTSTDPRGPTSARGSTARQSRALSERSTQSRSAGRSHAQRDSASNQHRSSNQSKTDSAGRSPRRSRRSDPRSSSSAGSTAERGSSTVDGASTLPDDDNTAESVESPSAPDEDGPDDPSDTDDVGEMLPSGEESTVDLGPEEDDRTAASPSGGGAVDVDPPSLDGSVDRSSGLPGSVSSLQYLGNRENHSTDRYPTYRYDPANTGHHPQHDPVTGGEPEQRWCFRRDEPFFSSPAVVGEVVYVGCRDGNVYAIDVVQERIVDRVPTHSTFDASPAVVDSTVFIGDRDGHLFALDRSDLTPLWDTTFDDGFVASPTVAEGRVHVATMAGEVCALDADSNNRLWRTRLEGSVATTPAVTRKYTYVGTGIRDENGGAVVAFTRHGQEAWRHSLDDPVISSPAVADGTVFVGCKDGTVYALDAERGDVRWRFATGGAVDASPAVAGDSVFVGSTDGRFYAIDRRTGEKRWATELGGQIAAPATVAGGCVYVGDDSGRFYALGADAGDKVWSYPTGEGAIKTNPAVADGGVYFGTGAGRLYALDVGTE